MQVIRSASAVRRQAVRLAGMDLELMFELAADTQTLVPAASMRISVDNLERVFGDAEVQMAVVSSLDLRYAYANAGYRNIRPEVRMLGRTYREIFPQAADGGAEERLKSVIRTSEAWIVDDYPTWLPERDAPAWWQGECVPIDLEGHGTDAALIMIWDVSHRHLPEPGPRPKSRGQLRIEAARVKLLARMATIGLTPALGWSVSEQIRETDDGTFWLLRPIHMHGVAPDWLVEQVDFLRAAAS